MRIDRLRVLDASEECVCHDAVDGFEGPGGGACQQDGIQVSWSDSTIHQGWQKRPCGATLLSGGVESVGGSC